jgi:hypothetical protein
MGDDIRHLEEPQNCTLSVKIGASNARDQAYTRTTPAAESAAPIQSSRFKMADLLRPLVRWLLRLGKYVREQTIVHKAVQIL